MARFREVRKTDGIIVHGDEVTILPGVEEVKKTDNITVVKPPHDLQLAVLESLVLGRSAGQQTGVERMELEFREWS